MIGRRLVVGGLVQGVFYRNWMVAAARELRLTGWVRNLRDGRVEVEVHGPAEAVEGLIARCRSGPPAARVDHVEISEASGPAPEDFRKLPTL